jgi:hypothetical protein
MAGISRRLLVPSSQLLAIMASPFAAPAAAIKGDGEDTVVTATFSFPTWHRTCLLQLEDALWAVSGCQDVAMAFWVALARTNSENLPDSDSLIRK